jgi:cytochrome c oxidase subunit 2
MMDLTFVHPGLPGASAWWLPTNYAEHGGPIDALFTAIFWITVAVLVGVHVLLVAFLVRYRTKPGRDTATFVHGHTRLEQVYTIAPAIVLAGLALASKRVWDGYNLPATGDNAKDVVRVMVIGQQFKWNVIYPGPDGVVGRYLVYPKPTDTSWPDGQRFRGTNGPAELPYVKAVEAINLYVEQINPLGKDFSDPDGDDDDWQNALARDLVVPVNRPVEVYLGSRDVIHDFAVPNLRVKLDAVPGMVGVVRFTPTVTTDSVPNGPGYFDIVCQELCGSGHYTMQGRLFVVADDATYAKRFPTTTGAAR